MDHVPRARCRAAVAALAAVAGLGASPRALAQAQPTAPVGAELPVDAIGADQGPARGPGAPAVGDPLAVRAPNAPTLVWSAAQSFVHDSNVLRLPSSRSPASLGVDKPRGDLVSRTAAGLDFDRQFGVQRVRATASVEAVRFAEYRALDHEAYALTGRWDWAAGSRWFGTANARADRFLGSPGDTRSARPALVERQLARASGGWRLTPSWAVLGAVEASRRTNAGGAALLESVREAAVELGLGLQPAAAYDLAFLVRRARGGFDSPERRDAVTGALLAARFDDDYVDDRLLARLDLEPTGASRLSGVIGFTRRRYDSLAQRDFSGFTPSLTYQWRPREALVVTAYARRDVGAYDFVASSLADNRIVGVRPEWQATGRLALLGVVERIERRFTGEPGGSAAGASGRTDRLHVFGLGVRHELLHWLLLRAELRQERRRSSDPGFDFDARVALATLEMRF